MVSKVMIIVIAGAYLWASAESITHVFNPISRQITKIVSPEPGACIVAGTYCASCTSVSECIDLGNGDFLKQDGIATCDGGSCSSVTGSCTTNPNPECDLNMKDYSLDCRQIGLFPHPFNTSKYFICPPNATDIGKPEDVGKLLNCSAGFAYDVYSGLCRVKVPLNTFNLVIPPCKTTTRGAIPNHPSMYYICLKKAATDTVFFPQLFTCTNNQFYNNGTKLCQERSSSIADGKCTSKGLFYESAACGTYTECTTNSSVPIKRTCSTGWYYDEVKGACSVYTCLNVKN